LSSFSIYKFYLTILSNIWKKKFCSIFMAVLFMSN
jgi:hypothetical protein